MSKRSFKKAIYIDLITGKIDKATGFSLNTKYCSQHPDMAWITNVYTYTSMRKEFSADEQSWYIRWGRQNKKIMLTNEQFEKRKQHVANQIYQKLIS